MNRSPGHVLDKQLPEPLETLKKEGFILAKGKNSKIFDREGLVDLTVEWEIILPP